MADKNNLARNHFSTKSTINWLLDIGYHFGTMTPGQAEKIARVNRTTWGRWLSGQSSAPDATIELLRPHAFGEPPAGFSKAWAGFRFQNDQLIYADHQAFTPGDIKAVFYWRKMAFEYLHRNGGIDYAAIQNDLDKIAAA